MPTISGSGGGLPGVNVSGSPVASQTVIASSGSAAAWGYPPGFEFDYVQTTSSLTVTATTEATAQAYIDGNAVTYDGSTRIKVEFWVGSVTVIQGTAVPILLDGATSLGWFHQLGQDIATNQWHWGGYGVRFLTPTAAAHTYHIAWWKTAGSGTVTVTSGAGGVGAQMPAWYRITKA